jgi:hypothetical protein
VFVCVQAQVGGQITGKGVDNDVDLHAVCTDGREFSVADSDAVGEPGTAQTYEIAIPRMEALSQVAKCGGHTQLAGFYFRIQVDEAGKFDDWYAVGAQSCGSGKPFSATMDNQTRTDPGDFTEDAWRLQIAGLHHDWLFAPDVFLRDQVLRCDLNLTEDNYPGR